MKIIAADVGGTKAHFTYTDSSRPRDPEHEAIYASNAFDSFEKLLDTFIEESGARHDLETLVLALPGPITAGEIRLTNLPWSIDRASLQQRFALHDVCLINDFQASALGTALLSDDELITLFQADASTHQDGALRVVIGAGTGLGVSWMLADARGYQAYATEGGHIDFAPVDAEQAELLAFLAERYGHVSYERLLSGAGLLNIYRFCSGNEETGIDAAWVNAEAVRGEESARNAMRLFTRVYGAFAGNMALLFKPPGGIYITGGVAAKMLDWMQSEHFTQAYLDKGRMQHVVAECAVHLVLNQRVGVLGAVSAASRQQETRQ